MKKFFYELDNKKISDLKDSEINYLQDFLNDGIIIQNEDRYEINSKYKIGLIKIENNRVVLEDLSNEHKNITLTHDVLNGAYNGDLVVAKRIFNPRSSIKAKIIKIIHGEENSILVYVNENSFYTVKENIKLNNIGANTYNQGDILLVDNNSFKLIKNLGNIQNPDIDELISLYLYNEEYRLEKEKSIDFAMDDKNQRVDLRDLPFCTIDPNSAKDHDDAIYYDTKEEILYVAIADVSYFVEENSVLDKLAYKKSTSAYLPSKVLPMLPNYLSEDLCSLKEGVDRYAYVFKLHLDTNNMQVKKSELFQAVINSHKKYSYGRIDRVLSNKLDQYDDVDKNIFDYLIRLYEITKNFRTNRLKKGYEFRNAENRLKLKNNKLQGVEIEKSTPSHQLIEECMLLANIQASKRLDLIGIYRTHEEPMFKTISKLIDDINILGLEVSMKNNVHDTITHIQEKAKYSQLEEEVDELIIKAQTQAKYTSTNQGHFGLGFSSYSHFTSPIRRYSDLILHRMLKSKIVPSNIDDICEHISNNERKIDMMVWDYEDRKYARWASEHIGEYIKVKITDTLKAKAICYSNMIGLKVNIDNYKGQKLFTKLKVKIKSVDIITKEVVVTINY